MYRILVIEDEAEISSIVEKYLIKNQFEPVVCNNGFDGLKKIVEETFHLIVLDVMMPGIDGFEVLERIRKTSDIPVIMLTAKSEEIDRIKGFRYGADDYVLKPFSPRELMERIKVFIKRVYGDQDEIMIIAGDITLYEQSMKVTIGNNEVDFTSFEFKILLTLMRNKNIILTREQLIEKSFGNQYDGFDRNVDSYIKRIRKKIEKNPKQPQYLKTKYGQGYIFVGDES